MREKAAPTLPESLPDLPGGAVEITDEMLVEHIILAHPQTRDIFTAFQIDCDSQGSWMLKRFGQSRGVDVDALVLALNQSLNIHGGSVPVPELLWRSSCDGMMVIDANRRILALNPALERWIGRPGREVVGRGACGTLFACQDLHGEVLWDRPDRCQGIRAMCRLKSVAEAEYTIRTASGRRIATSASYTPIQRTPGGPVWALVVMRDGRLQKRREHQLLRQAATDPLTRLPNRAVFFAACARELNRASRHGRPLAVAMVDMDGFKAHNDAYGHLAGDELLKALAEVLRSGLRTTELVARYGGDEFVLLLPDTDATGATAVAQRLCQMVAEFPFARAQGNGHPVSAERPTASLPAQGSAGPVTCSIGVAVFPDDGHAVEVLLAEADCRLFEAKQQGRHCVVGPRPTGERRRQRRVELEAPIQIHSLREGAEGLGHDGVTKNLGLAGVVLTVPQWKPIAAGEEMMFSIPIPFQRPHGFPFSRLSGHGRVVRVEEDPRREQGGQKRLVIALAFGEDLTALASAAGDRGSDVLAS